MASPAKKNNPVDQNEAPRALSRHKRPPLHPTFSGELECLRCGQCFVSWDRRRNRLCSACAKKSW